MNLLAWDPAVTYEEGVALGGWKTGCNRDWYVWTYLCAIVFAVLALAGYPDPRILPQLPTCNILFHDTVATKVLDVSKFPAALINALYYDIPTFEP